MPDKKLWNERYITNEIPWDIGYVAPPLKDYFDQLTDKNLKILIPGSGSSYEAEYLHKSSFTNVFALDWSDAALEGFKNRVEDFPSSHIITGDFFKQTGKYDLIIEQTFFCAIEPSFRQAYANQVYKLLKPKGKLVGLLFNDELYADRPPYGGSAEEYKKYFEKNFEFKVYETAYNSIPPRQNREIFIILVAKQ